MSQPAAQTGYEVQWFDVRRERDRQVLTELELIDGDMIAVNEAAPAVRILGTVQQPGSYHIPSNHGITLPETLQLAGGVSQADAPLNVSLYRPAGSGHSARRWVMSLKDLTERPEDSPVVQPGDLIHVEQPRGNMLKRLMTGWSKP